ncbi:MAG: hypothetical protein WBX01_01795 [Nitrososphaeraceae archaeon]
MIFSSITDMLIGMVLGMIASPLLMKLIRSLQSKRKVDRILREAAADLQNRNNDNSNINPA